MHRWLRVVLTAFVLSVAVASEVEIVRAVPCNYMSVRSNCYLDAG